MNLIFPNGAADWRDPAVLLCRGLGATAAVAVLQSTSLTDKCIEVSTHKPPPVMRLALIFITPSLWLQLAIVMRASLNPDGFVSIRFMSI